MQPQQHKTFTYKNTSFTSHRNSMNVHWRKMYINYRNLSGLKVITLPSLLTTPTQKRILVPYGFYFKARYARSLHRTLAKIF